KDYTLAVTKKRFAALRAEYEAAHPISFNQSQVDRGGRALAAERNGSVALSPVELADLPDRNRKEALADLKEIAGDYTLATGETVGISRRVTDKALSGFANAIKRSLVRSFPQILESA